MSLLQLIRRHPAIRRLPHWQLVALVGTNLLLGMIARASATGTPHSGEFLVGIAWLILGFFFIGGGDRRRCQDLDLALPIAARRLWLGHVLAMLAVGLAQLAVIVGLLLGIHALLRGLGDNGLIAALPPRGLLLLPAAWLTLVGWREWRVGGAVERAGGRSGRLAALAEVLVLLAVILPLLRVPGGELVLLLAAGLFLALAARDLPPALSLLPREAAAGAASPAAPFVAPRRSAPLRLLWATVLRASAKNLPALAAGWCFLLFFGMLLGGILPDYAQLRVPMLPIVVYMLFALVAKPLVKLAAFDAWPLSRQRLLAMVVLPAIILLVLGYGLGRIVDRLREPRPEAFRVSVVDEGDQLVVPVRLCEIAWDGQPPSLAAPWGERRQAWREPLLRGARPCVYSPFSAPAGCSPDFFAWQLSRAVAAQHGVSIPADTLRDRYLSTDDSGRLRVRTGGLTVARDFDLRGPRGRSPWFPIVVGLPIAITLALLAGHLRQFRSDRSDRRRRLAFFVVLALLLALHIGVFATFMMDLVADFALGGVLAIGMRHAAAALPYADALLGVGVGILIAVAWLFALRALERAELPAESPKGSGCL